jgi:REP element-mobilizing transposase RayT
VGAPSPLGEADKGVIVTHQATPHRRRSLRLQGYDYAQAGAYFTTICTQDRVCLFGAVADGAMRLSAAGELAATVWSKLPLRFPDIDLDAFVIMPNHIHGIIVLADRAPTIGKVVGTFKSLFALEYIRGVRSSRWPAFDGRVWQRNYYEHVIRDETDLNRIRQYIDENPLRWELDEENPQWLRAGGHP